MSLATHMRVMWRFRAVMAAGIVLGIALAFLAIFQVPSLERRGTETWASESSILVTQDGFPWGRVTLPDTATDPATQGKQNDTNQQEFADPGRFSNLAMLYSVISYSDVVRRRLPDKPKPGQIQAVPLDATGNGTQFLPIIKLTTLAKTALGAKRLNQQALDGLRSLWLQAGQDANAIDKKQRIELSVLNAPSAPQLVSGRSKTPAILALMLCTLAAFAIAHILEALRPRPGAEQAAPRLAGIVDPIEPEPVMDDEPIEAQAGRLQWLQR